MKNLEIILNVGEDAANYIKTEKARHLLAFSFFSTLFRIQKNRFAPLHSAKSHLKIVQESLAR